MRIYSEQKIVTQVCTEIICDRCGTRIPEDNGTEWQEAYRIEFTGGYGSVFGDGNHVECDLCQSCLHTLIGKFAHTTPESQPGDNAMEQNDD